MAHSDLTAPWAAMVGPNRVSAPCELHRNVSRAALVRHLTEVEHDVSLVLLVAPVGYGKTTTILEWSRTVRRPVAWVKVTAGVRSRAHLMEELILALPTGPAHEMPAAARASAKDLPPEEAADVLASSIADVDTPVTIVLDDLHLLRTRSALLVVALARRLPAGNRITAMSDHRPRLHLGRLRSEQRCLELGPGDLAFSEEEVAGLLRGAGLDLGPQAVRELVRRTEGWPTGVRLTARALREKPDPTTFVAELDGTVNVIADYFRGEVLAHLSGETTRFLLRTAVLDRMCASLCDAVLGRSGSAAWLEEVDELGLFVVPEDDRGEWFRYHRLFREMLRRELRHREPGQDLRILRRAALWYEARGHTRRRSRALSPAGPS